MNVPCHVKIGLEGIGDGAGSDHLMYLQSDQGLHYWLTESFDTLEYINVKGPFMNVRGLYNEYLMIILG